MRKKSRAKDSYSINSSTTYWDWVANNCDNEDGVYLEPVRANPDMLSEEQGIIWYQNDIERRENKIKTVRAIFNVLNKEEKQVAELLMRKKTYREIAKICDIYHVKVSRIVKKLRKKFEIVYQNSDWPIYSEGHQRD